MVGEGEAIPDSILASMDLAHLRNVSSTFSPVIALVSRNKRSKISSNSMQVNQTKSS